MLSRSCRNVLCKADTHNKCPCKLTRPHKFRGKSTGHWLRDPRSLWSSDSPQSTATCPSRSEPPTTCANWSLAAPWKVLWLHRNMILPCTCPWSCGWRTRSHGAAVCSRLLRARVTWRCQWLRACIKRVVHSEPRRLGTTHFHVCDREKASKTNIKTSILLLKNKGNIHIWWNRDWNCARHYGPFPISVVPNFCAKPPHLLEDLRTLGRSKVLSVSLVSTWIHVHLIRYWSGSCVVLSESSNLLVNLSFLGMPSSFLQVSNSNQAAGPCNDVLGFDCAKGCLDSPCQSLKRFALQSKGKARQACEGVVGLKFLGGNPAAFQ